MIDTELEKDLAGGSGCAIKQHIHQDHMTRGNSGNKVPPVEFMAQPKGY